VDLEASFLRDFKRGVSKYNPLCGRNPIETDLD